MWMSFVKLHPDADASQVAQKMNDIYAKNRQTNVKASLRLLTDAYLDTDFNRGDATKVSIFALLGILLLCTACINYINLTTASVDQRSKEVGVKKIIGAKRRSLFVQFVAKTLVISFAATIGALFLIQLLSPHYQSLVNIPASFSSPVRNMGNNRHCINLCNHSQRCLSGIDALVVSTGYYFERHESSQTKKQFLTQGSGSISVYLVGSHDYLCDNDIQTNAVYSKHRTGLSKRAYRSNSNA